MADQKIYAGYPSATLQETLNPKSKKHKLLWGDTMIVSNEASAEGPYLAVTCRGKPGYVLREQTQAEHLLDLIFLDVGQGDSAIMITPLGERVLIDFGQTDNTFRYLRWRYRDLKKVKFAAAVLSHADEDHYEGLDWFCRGSDPEEEKFRFATLFHNGLIGQAPTTRSGGHAYYTNLETNRSQFEEACRRGDKGVQLRDLLQRALARGRIGDLRSLSAADGVLPGVKQPPGFRVEVLGPLLEPDERGRPRLRSLGGFDKTKNGHSVILKITYGAVRIMLGGDLNSPGQDLLLAHYEGGRAGDEALKVARDRLEVDVLKAFHHGAGPDASVRFLQAMNPVATVISSGDNETHSHPRADALGTIGRWSRIARPYILCTELARSSGDLTQHPQVLRKRAGEAPGTPEEQNERDRQLDSSIARYGAINLRTDGRRVLLAQRVESGHDWDIYDLKLDEDNERRITPGARRPTG